MTHLLSDPNLAPSQSGEPRGTVDVRVPPLPAIPGSAGQDVPEGLGAFGQGVEALGTAAHHQAVVGYQLAQVAEKKRQALQTLDAQALTQNVLQAVESFESEDQRNPATRDHPQRLRQFLDKQLGQLSPAISKLDPLAQAHFRADVEKHFTLVNRRAEDFSFGRDAESAKVMIEAAGKQYERERLSATNPLETQAAEQTYRSTLDKFTEGGWLFPGQGAAMQKAANEGISEAEMKLQIRNDPYGAIAHLRALDAKTAGTPGFPIPPMAKIPALIDEAHQHILATLQSQQQWDTHKEKLIGQQQDQNAGQLRQQMQQTVPTQANLPKYDAFMTQIGQMADRKEINEAHRTELLGLARTLKGEAQKPGPLHDDETTYNRVLLDVMTTATPMDVARVRTSLIQAKSSLTSPTWEALMGKLDAREKENHYSTWASYKHGIEIIQRGEIPMSKSTGGLPTYLDADQVKRLAIATDAYDRKFTEVTQDPKNALGGRPLADTEADNWAWQFRRFYLEKGREGKLPALPVYLQGRAGKGLVSPESGYPYYDDEVMPIIQAVPGMTDAQRWADLQRYRAWADTVTGVKENPEYQRRQAH